MENQVEDDVRKRWAQEAKDKQDAEGSRPKKRPREIEYNGNGLMGAFLPLLGNGASGSMSLEEAGASRAKTKKKPAPRGTRSRGKITEDTHEDEDYIELD